MPASWLPPGPATASSWRDGGCGSAAATPSARRGARGGEGGVALVPPSSTTPACRMETGLEPRPLLRFLQGLERELGRRPGGERWGPRPLDLDVLLCEARAIGEGDL